MASDTTNWPVLGDRRPLPHRPAPVPRPARARSAWLLAGLAFLCGGLVSAAVFTIGWRHQAQRNTAAETALAAATARDHELSASLAAARRADKRDHALALRRATEAKAAASALSEAAASIDSETATARDAATPVAAGAKTASATAGKIANELRNLTTYLTTTPSGQIDSGYVASQAAYLERQLGQLQTTGTNVGGAVSSLQSALGKLARLASSLTTRS